MSARDLEGEIRELRARIATLVDEAAANERLLKRSQERELELLKAENLAQTFDSICGGLKESYALESVTLLVLDPQLKSGPADRRSPARRGFPERAVHGQPHRARAAIRFVPPAVARPVHGLRSSAAVSR